MYQDLFTQIRDLEQKVVGKQKILAQYLLSHFEETSFQTVAQVASKAAVSESTVVRFARALGYKGFPQLKDEFQSVILGKLAPSERLHRIFETPEKLENIIHEVFGSETRNLKETQSKFQFGNIKQIAQCIIAANKKYVVGLRASAGCAYLLGHFLSHILPDITTILDGDSRLFEGIKTIGEKDVLIAISYPRYTKFTVEALQFARNRQATTISITDSELSPAAQVSNLILIAPANSITYANSYTACLSLINALITLITHLDRETTETMLQEWDRALEKFDFFFKG